ARDRLRGRGPSDEDLRPRPARTRERGRRTRDRDRVRLDDGRAARLPRARRPQLQPADQPRVGAPALATIEKPRIAEIPTDVEVDPVTLDIIEGALKSARFEMDAVLFRSAMSPVIREQHDEFPMITDPRGR